MAKGRRNGSQSRTSAQRLARLEKAVNANFMQMAAEAPKGLQPVPSRQGFALMDAINMATGGMGFEPLPRDPFNTTAFGPMDPLVPDPIDGIGPDGRSQPRTWEYSVGWNLPGSGNREVPWQVLRAASVGVGIIRRCIEVRKRHLRDLDFSFAPTQRAITELYEQDPSKGKLEAERVLRERLMPEIRRLEEYWEHPWRGNDLSFGQWTNAVIDDYLTFDAVAVYPQMSFGGEVLNLQLIDPSTIKILVDQYGNRPASPHPAFQQILYGFPRGEWAASVTRDAEGNEVLENGFASSEMFYYRENYRTSSPYGLSAVEQALIDSRLYLQRQKWMLAEYDDGSTPLTFLETPVPSAEAPGLTLAQARQWIEALNRKNAGNISGRVGMKPLPNGWVPHPMPGIDERYRPEYDLFLIKLLCSYFGVPASELGFSENSGLGGKGWSEGQAKVSGRVGQRPDTAVVSDIVNGLSRQFLRMPKELCGGFNDPAGVNDAESAAITVGQINSGQITINDARDALGKARLSFPEADMPFILAGPAGITFLEGAKAAADAAVQQAQITAEATAAGTVGKLELEGKKLEDGKAAREADHELARETRDLNLEAQAATVAKSAGPDDDDVSDGERAAQNAELAAFRNWRRKQRDREPSRPFVFKHITPDTDPVLVDVSPVYADFGPDWAWVEEAYELEKRASSGLSWLEWNARNPTRPRDAKGRWVKAGSFESTVPSLPDALTDQERKREKLARANAVRAVGNPVRQLYHDAGAAGLAKDVERLDEADRALRAAGGQLFAMPETVHKFDRALHKPIEGGSWPTGRVVIVKPGLRMDDGTILEKADVQPFGDDEDEGSIAAFWADQEFDMHTLMKDRELRWTVVGAPTTVEPVNRGKPKAFRLVRILPNGTEKAWPGTFANQREALTAASRSLHDNNVASKADAQRFAAMLGRSELGSLVPHESGYSFRLEGVWDDIAHFEARTESLMEPVTEISAGSLVRARGSKKRLYVTGVDDEFVYVDNVNGQPRKYRRSQVAIVTKAAAPEPGDGGAGPKEPAPEETPDARWPGWLTDLAIAAVVAPMLLSAMRGLITSVTLISLLKKLLATPVEQIAPADTPLQARERLRGAVRMAQDAFRAEPGVLDEVVAAIEPGIRQAHIEGALTGEKSAEAMVDWVTSGNEARDAVSFEINWGDWEPGHPEAAQLLLRPQGLESLLAQSDHTIRGIAANRLDRLGEIIGQGLARGDAPATIGRAIAAEFGNENWAHMVALTETNRAQSAAAVAGYEAAGMQFKGWMTANDQRVCKICKHNEQHPDGTPRVVMIGSLFPSGVPWPPGHPRCRCAPIPVIKFMRTMAPVPARAQEG